MAADGAHVTVRIRPNPIVKVEVYMQSAREVIAHLGGGARECDIAQLAIENGWLQAVTVYGLDSDGFQRMKCVYTVDQDRDGVVHVDLDGGQRSMVEALDGGFAKALEYQRAKMARRTLKPDFYFRLTPEVRSDEVRYAEVCSALGIEPVAPPPLRPGRTERQLLSLSPGKARGITFSLWDDV